VSDVVLDVRGVTHRHGRSQPPVLTDVSLQVLAAETVAVAGRSGSGKSTLCHLAAGFAEPREGSVLVGGRPATEVDDWRVRAFLPQRLGISGELTVAENVALPRVVRGLDGDVAALLAALDLEGVAGQPATRTSLGEQQRTALARTLALGPALLLLDEPTGHQDDDHVLLVLDALAAASAGGTAVLVATHDERVIERADRVLRLAGGVLQGVSGS
jgi:ABC-type lipoprotein export system ATPase subunit